MFAKKKLQILPKILFYVSSVLIALTVNIVLLLMILFAHVIF